MWVRSAAGLFHQKIRCEATRRGPERGGVYVRSLLTFPDIFVIFCTGNVKRVQFDNCVRLTIIGFSEQRIKISCSEMLTFPVLSAVRPANTARAGTSTSPTGAAQHCARWNWWTLRALGLVDTARAGTGGHCARWDW